MWQGPDGGARIRRSALMVMVMVAGGLWATAPALGQGDEPSTDGAATGTSEGVRADWTLHTSAAPAFSIQLPPGWAIAPATDGSLGATGPDGETLVVRLDESAAGAPLDTYTKRSWRSVEKDVEALAADGRNVAGGALTEPLYRQTAGGLVARLGVARPADEVDDDSHVTARFLTAPCEDGARTVEISGPAPEPDSDGAPDLWDRIAASVSPCSSEPMPELVLDPAVTELRAAYGAEAQAFNPKLAAAFDELNKGGSLRTWARNSIRIADLYDEFRKQILALPWTAETRPLAEAQAAGYREVSDFFRKKMARAKTNRAISSLEKQYGRIFGSNQDAIDATRLAIGLPVTFRS